MPNIVGEMGAPAIRTLGLTKDYGLGRGLFDLDLHIAGPEVFGYLGPNGAGKTTTIRLLLGLLQPSAGRAEVLGFDTRTRAGEIRSRAGKRWPTSRLVRLVTRRSSSIRSSVVKVSAMRRSVPVLN